MNHERTSRDQETSSFVELLGVDPLRLMDNHDAVEKYYAQLARKWADGEPYFIVDASTINNEGFDIGYFDGKQLTTSIRFSYDNGCDVECGNFRKKGVELDYALTLTRTLNHHLTPEGRDKLFQNE